MIRAFACVCWALVATIPTYQNAIAAPELHVVDGDTLDLNGVRYRLHGIDAPEAGQTCASRNGGNWRCGKQAIAKLQDLIAGKHVRCDPGKADDYGRIVAICRAEGVDVGAAMIMSGFAWAFTKYSRDYVRLESEAKASKTGVWQSKTQTAWDYRAEKWEVGVQLAPKGCPIKGNINQKKQKIYHVPWSRDYAKTKVSLEKGELWFCSERDAMKAGFRAPRWGK